MSEQDRIKEKLILVLINLISRAIEDARKVPYVMEQDNLVDILINNPDIYQQMVLEGQIEGDGMPTGKVVVKLDILSQMQEFELLDQYDMTLASMAGHQESSSPVFNQINLLSKMFMAYISNMITTFEKSYEDFLERYRRTMRDAGQPVELVEISWEDLKNVRKSAEGMLACGHFIEAFSFGRLFDPEVVASDLFHFPAADDSLAQMLLLKPPSDIDQYRRLVKFILRVCYISHNHWQDIFFTLADLAEREPERYRRPLLVEMIDQDSVFCCNLLHQTTESLLGWTPAQRQEAIEKALAQRQIKW